VTFKIRKAIVRALIAAVLNGCSPWAYATEEGLLAWWKFDEGSGDTVLETVTGRLDLIGGNFRRIAATAGERCIKCLKFDGYTTRIVCDSADAPSLDGAFTIQAWVAPQAYPWNWCAIVSQEREHKAGYFFGIDQLGHVGLHVAVDGKWYECTTKQSIAFMTKWSHITGIFDVGNGITVYINGSAAARLQLKGKFIPADGVDLLIGRNHEKSLLEPGSLVRPGVNFPCSYSFDGLIDEVKIYNRALSGEEIMQAYRQGGPRSAPPLKWRKLPRLPAGKNRFGAVYCKLDFYPEWDALWRVAEHPDVVVAFDDGPYKMIFWRGTNYNMNMVTENGRWIGDQSAEEGGKGTVGCCEHMSDKQCWYAHIRLIENHNARVVVHWRYALCDVLYQIADALETTDWGLWADEYYYIYPDGVAVRSFAVYGAGGCSITEPTVLNQPGEKAEDNIELAALTMADLEGQKRTYSWQKWPGSGKVGGDFSNPLPNGNICFLNLKSKYKPFYIYEPGTRVIPYGGGTKELRPEYSHFPTWNHWPVSQVPSDGRYALVPDRVSSSAIISPEPPMRRRTQDGAVTGRFIMGLSNRKIEDLVPLARSWIQPAGLTIENVGYKSVGYGRDQRAYLIEKQSSSEPQLRLKLNCTNDRPAVNPAFVVREWGDEKARLEIDGREIKRGRKFRYGYRRTLDGTDLIIWLQLEATEPVDILLLPVGE